MPPERAVYGLWLDVKGKVLGDAWLWRERDEAWMVFSFGSTATDIQTRLEHHLVADEVTIEDQTARWGALTVVGVETEGMRSPVDRGRAAPSGTAVVPATPLGWWLESRWVPGAVEWVFPAAERGAVLAWLSERGVRALEPATLEAARLAAGVPMVPVDIGPGDLPQEGGLEVEAVSFTKGCYVGQEVMARLHAMGQVRRRLVALEGTGELPAVGAQLWQGGRAVGTVRSVVQTNANVWRAFGMVSLVHARPGMMGRGPAAVPDINWRSDDRA